VLQRGIQRVCTEASHGAGGLRVCSCARLRGAVAVFVWLRPAFVSLRPAFAKASARQNFACGEVLEVRGFEPLASSLRTTRSTN
jgi:hypothetical protein